MTTKLRGVSIMESTFAAIQTIAKNEQTTMREVAEKFFEHGFKALQDGFEFNFKKMSKFIEGPEKPGKPKTIVEDDQEEKTVIRMGKRKV